MHPILFRLPVPAFLREALAALGFSLPDGIPVFSYGFMVMLAFLAAALLAVRAAKREGIDPERIYDISFLALVGGLVGARLLWIVQEGGAEAVRSFGDAIAVWRGGLVFYGGLLGGIGFALLYMRRARLPVSLTLDCFAPGLAAGLFFGRIGCFLNGCCFGAACPADAWYGVSFPPDSLAAYHQHGPVAGGHLAAAPLYPSQVLESLAGLVILLLLRLYFRPRRRFAGELILRFVQLYTLARFSIEFVRDDTSYYLPVGRFPGFHPGQLLSVLLFLGATGLWILLRRRASSSKGNAA